MGSYTHAASGSVGTAGRRLRRGRLALRTPVRPSSGLPTTPKLAVEAGYNLPYWIKIKIKIKTPEWRTCGG